MMSNARGRFSRPHSQNPVTNVRSMGVGVCPNLVSSTSGHQRNKTKKMVERIARDPGRASPAKLPISRDNRISRTGAAGTFCLSRSLPRREEVLLSLDWPRRSGSLVPRDENSLSAPAKLGNLVPIGHRPSQSIHALFFCQAPVGLPASGGPQDKTSPMARVPFLSTLPG